MKAEADVKIISSLIFLLLAIFSLPKPAMGANKTDYYNLHYFLFGGDFYEKDVRPVDNDSIPLYIYMEFNLLSLVEVDEKDQKMVTNARLVIEWSDGYLSWTPSDYGGIKTLMVPQGRIWLPDVVVGNGVTAQTRLGYDPLPVRLTYDGWIDWQPSLLLSTSCDIEITYFPFDTQRCTVVFETALSTYDEVDVSIDKHDPILLTDYSEDGQWKLKGTKAENLLNENGKSRIQYTITLTRRRTFYLIYIIMPIFFISLTSSLVFALPADEGEKISTGITVVLAFAVYLTIVANIVPNTSLQVSILGVYLILLLGLSATSLMVCAFILRIHFRDNSTSVGRKTKKTVIVLRKITFMQPLGNPRNSVSPIGNGDLEDSDDPRDKPSTHTPPTLLSFPQQKMTWQVVAATFDWFCFILFFSLTIVTTIACTLALEIGSVENAP